MPLLVRLGYDKRNWLRIAQITAWTDFLRTTGAAHIGEVSPGWNSMWAGVPALSYTALQYPDFDIAKDRTEQQFDIVIADQVLEHVLDATAAIQNIFAMVRPGGFALVATPFLFRVHARPHDYHRWTEPALIALCEGAGFKTIQSASWGNKACAKAHIGGGVKSYGFGRDMSNDPEYPIMVWVIGQRPA